MDTQGYTSDSDAISTITPIVKDAVIATFVRTIEEFFKLEKQKSINDKLLKKKSQQEANTTAAATANETERVLKELENGKSLKDLIDEHLKNSKPSKGQRGVKHQKKTNASLNNKNIVKEQMKKKKNVGKKDSRNKGSERGNSVAGKNKDSENARPNAPKKNMRKEKKKKAPTKQRS